MRPLSVRAAGLRSAPVPSTPRRTRAVNVVAGCGVAMRETRPVPCCAGEVGSTLRRRRAVVLPTATIALGLHPAGLRDAQDVLEIEGIRRSRESLARAELILHVFDASEPLTPADAAYLAEFAGKKRVLVGNKADLPVRLELPAGLTCVQVSCLSGQGIETLKAAIQALLWNGEIKAEMWQVAINSRHQDALKRARDVTKLALAALRAGTSLELVAMDLRIAANAVGEIVGKTTTEDLLDSIFSTFCIGK